MTNYNFQKALEMMRSGKLMRRSDWKNEFYAITIIDDEFYEKSLHGSRCVTDREKDIFSAQDILSNKWTESDEF